ncbi:putative MFS-type transporter C09D4.1-like protein [Leptotrombidium deliense]|uniref:Putative MFS-type transporter C09D4.1-like protein n=1 Tax=Leptotrombidium deliense TaxID=299467 RepID=A0A443SBZ9_9ACAR|nr:putative MFS-type transporter C09D4.1-like protein [Leptotrombidium deliense]
MVQVYKKRFLMLFLMCFTNFSLMFQSFQYTSISDVVANYYQVSDVAVTFTSISGNIAFVVLVYLGMLIVDKGGIRGAMTFAAVCNWLGALIKYFSLQRSRFDVLIIGQIVSSIGQITSMPLPPLLAAVWFANKEAAIVVGLNFGSCTLAVAFTFVVSTVLFKDSENINNVATDLKTLAIIVISVTSLCLVLVVIFFREKPKTSPSFSQNHREQNEQQKSSLILLFKNFDFNCLLIAFILNFSVENTLTVILNQSLRSVFGDDTTVVTICGTSFMVSGIIGAITIPLLLDRFKSFKLISMISYISSVIGLIAILTSIYFANTISLYVSIVAFGIFMYGFASIAADIAVDVTYPFPESKTSGVMFFTSTLVGITLAPTASSLIDKIGIYFTLIILIALMIIGGIALFCAKWNLKRNEIEIKDSNQSSQLQTVYCVQNGAITKC